MRRSSRYTVGFIAGAAFTLVLLFALARWVEGAAPEAGRWTAEILAKKREAAVQTNPRLLILAGSNALFGFSAQRITDEHGIPAVNLASNVGLGLPYLLDFARPFLRAGVIVVLPLEYRLYGPSRWGQTRFLHLLGYDPVYFRGLPLLDQLDVLTETGWGGWARIIKAKLLGDTRRNDGYQSSTLNDYGDETVNRVENRYPFASARLANAASSRERLVLDSEALALIEEFARYAAARNARVVVTFPNVLKGTVDFDLNRKFIDGLRDGLASRGIPLIGSPEANAFDLDLAFDTSAHPIRDGQNAATDRLMGDLKRAGLI